MLKTAGEGSFKIASKSEKLLAGNDIEGILAVIDDDLLAEPNDLNRELLFMPKLQKNI